MARHFTASHWAELGHIVTLSSKKEMQSLLAWPQSSKATLYKYGVIINRNQSNRYWGASSLTTERLQRMTNTPLLFIQDSEKVDRYDVWEIQNLL